MSNFNIFKRMKFLNSLPYSSTACSLLCAKSTVYQHNLKCGLGRRNFLNPIIHGHSPAVVVLEEEEERPLSPSSDIVPLDEEMDGEVEEIVVNSRGSSTLPAVVENTIVEVEVISELTLVSGSGSKKKRKKRVSTVGQATCSTVVCEEEDIIVLSDSESEDTLPDVVEMVEDNDDIIWIKEERVQSVQTVQSTQNTPKQEKTIEKDERVKRKSLSSTSSTTPKSTSTCDQGKPFIQTSETSLTSGSHPVSLTSVLARDPSKCDMLSRNTLEQCGQQARYFEFVKDAPGANFFPFRVCSYNVLCQATTLTTMYLYRHLKNNPLLLSWEHRWRMLSLELLSLNADVFGLQEVQDCHLPFYQNILQREYYIQYKRRTGGMYKDGCLLAVRKSRFNIVTYKEVEYFMGENCNMDKHQVGQVALLHDTSSGQQFIFANTHLLFNEKRGDIKLGQLATLFATIQKMQNGRRLPLFMTGDFNLEPFSQLYTFITQSRLCMKGVPRNHLSGQVDPKCPPGLVVTYPVLPPWSQITKESIFDGTRKDSSSSDLWTHPFELASVMSHRTRDDEKEVSTFHSGCGNPDFIFYAVEKKEFGVEKVSITELPDVQLVARLSLPSQQFLTSTLGCWPNCGVPSDHIPLVADFALKRK